MTNDEVEAAVKRLEEIVKERDAVTIPDVQKAAYAIRELLVENRLLHRSYNELYEKVYGPNVKPIYAHV